MSSITIGIIITVLFLIVIFKGVPVTISMMACGVIGSMFLLRSPMSAFSLLSGSVFGSFASYTLSVAPMFILMGELATESNIGRDLFDCFQKLTGHRKGGLASASQVVCAIFGAISGSTTATGAMMSRVAYPQMKRYKYDDMLSTGCIASGSCLDGLIPPSLHLITYGIAAEASIGRLLVGGITTGIVLMVLFIITIRIWCLVKPSIAPEAEKKATVKERLIAIKKGGFLEVVLIFGLAMGGMFAGWFTPTEAGAVGAAGMLIVAIAFKRFNFNVLLKSLKNTMIMSGMIYALLAGANCFGKFFTLTRIPDSLSLLVANLNIGPVAVIMLLSVIYLILGCFIDGIALILITTPIFLPVAVASGFDPVWFGLYIIVMISLGAVTPPVGMSCYVVSGTTGVSLNTVFKGSVPFLLSYLVMALLMALIPGIATWLPSLLL